MSNCRSARTFRGWISDFRLAVAIVIAAAGALNGQTLTLSASPTSLKFTYQTGGKLPTAQSLSIRATGGTPNYTVTVANPVDPMDTPLWITATPDSGRTPANLSVRVNPTGMSVGAYSARIVLSAGSAAISVPVALTITQPLPSLSIDQTTLAVTAPPLESSQEVVLTTTAGPVSFTASAAGISWLSVSPTSGYVLPGAPKRLTITVNASALSPQATPYTGRISVVASGVAPANRSQTITVSLTLNSSAPTITHPLWPSTAQAGSAATTVTIRGTAFYNATRIKITPEGATTPTTITPTVLGSSAMLVVIPTNLLATAQNLDVVASNPAGDSAPAVFTVSANPVVQAAVNLASYEVTAVSPGQLVTLFGAGIGPSTSTAMADADENGFVDTALDGVTVTIDGQVAPLLYVSADQISIQVPYEVTVGAAKPITVVSGSSTATGSVDIAPTAPALFTLDGSGTGQAAALNFSALTSTYSLNAASNAARPGDTVILYLTGEGDFATSLNPRTGYLVPSTLDPLPQLIPVPTVMIGGANATVAYAGPFVGSILGIMQLNVVVPGGSTTGAAVPVSVIIDGVTSQPGVTLSVRP